MEPIKCLSQIMVYRITDCSIRAIDSVLDHLEKFAKKSKTLEEASTMEGEMDCKESDTKEDHNTNASSRDKKSKSAKGRKRRAVSGNHVVEACGLSSTQSIMQTAGISEPQSHQKLSNTESKHSRNRDRSRNTGRQKGKALKSIMDQDTEAIKLRLRSNPFYKEQPMKESVPMETDSITSSSTWIETSISNDFSNNTTLTTGSGIAASNNNITTEGEPMRVEIKAKSGRQLSEVVSDNKRIHNKLSTVFSASTSKEKTNAQNDCLASKAKRMKGFEVNSHSFTKKDRSVKSQIESYDEKKRRAMTSVTNATTDVDAAPSNVKGKTETCNESSQEQKQISPNSGWTKVSRQKRDTKKDIVRDLKTKSIDKDVRHKRKERFIKDPKLNVVFKRRYCKRVEQNIQNNVAADRTRNTNEGTQQTAAINQTTSSPRRSGTKSASLEKHGDITSLGVENILQISRPQATDTDKQTNYGSKTVGSSYQRSWKQIDDGSFSLAKNSQLDSEFPALLNVAKHLSVKRPALAADNFQNNIIHPPTLVTGNVANNTLLTTHPEFKQGTPQRFTLISVNTSITGKNRHASNFSMPGAQTTRMDIAGGNTGYKQRSEHSLFSASTGESEELHPSLSDNKYCQISFNTTEAQEVPKKISPAYRALLRKDYQEINSRASTSTSNSDDYCMINPLEYHHTNRNRYNAFSASQTTQTDFQESVKERPPECNVYPMTTQYILLPTPANNEQQTVSLIDGVVRTLTREHDELDKESH